MSEGDEQDDSQRTEDPTPKKLEEAKKRGQVPMSKEANTWLMLMIGTVMIVALAPGMFERLTVLLHMFLDQSWQVVETPGLSRAIFRLFLDVLAIVSVPMLVLFLAAGVGPFAQIGPIFSTESIKPKLDKLSPIAGFKRLFSMKSMFEFLKGIAKVVLIGTVSYMVLQPFFDGLDRTIDLSIMELMKTILEIFIKMMSAILMTLLLLAGADVLFQRYTHMKQMRMSRQEIKDEYRQTEGDPVVKSRLRQVRMERARRRMMDNVPGATVVVTNPTHFAVALKYEPGEMDVPVCVAKGQDLIALKIREVAEANGVVIVENPPLARTLYASIDIDEGIPAEHYKAVAEVISYVFRLKKKL